MRSTSENHKHTTERLQKVTYTNGTKQYQCRSDSWQLTFCPHNSVDIMSADMQISIVVVLVHISNISPVPIGFRNHHALILKIINAIK